MLALFLTEAATGSLLALLLVPPRAAGRAFFRYCVGQSCVLIVLGLALTSPGTARGAFGWHAAAAILLAASAGLFHARRLNAGLALMIAAAGPAVAGVAANALALVRADGSGTPASWYAVDALSGGILTGSVLVAMILGHFYLNVPGLPIRFLVRLSLVALGAVLIRGALIGSSIAMNWGSLGPLFGLLLDTGGGAPPEATLDPFALIFLLVHVLFGVAAPAIFAFMAWRTARISSTQSATGILYVTLIVVIMGELAGRYLTSTTGLPL